MQYIDTGAVKIRLRLTRPDDLPALFDMQAEPESNAMAGTKPRTQEAFDAVWARIFAEQNVNAMVIEIEEAHGPRIVGSVSRFPAKDRDWVGYWIARSHWGKGIASRALRMFLAEERRRPLYASTASANARSRRILEKCGFRCMGLHQEGESERFLAREIAEYVLD